MAKGYENLKRKWKPEDYEEFKNDVAAGMPLSLLSAKYHRPTPGIAWKIRSEGLDYDLNGDTDYISLTEIAEILGCPRQKVGRWINKGKLKYVRSGQYKLIEEKSLFKFLKANQDQWCAHNCIYDYFSEFKWFKDKYKSEDYFILAKFDNRVNWKTEDIQRLYIYTNKGMSDKEIAERVGKTVQAVRNKKYTLRKEGKLNGNKV